MLFKLHRTEEVNAFSFLILNLNVIKAISLNSLIRTGNKWSDVSVDVDIVRVKLASFYKVFQYSLSLTSHDRNTLKNLFSNYWGS